MRQRISESRKPPFEPLAKLAWIADSVSCRPERARDGLGPLRGRRVLRGLRLGRGVGLLPREGEVDVAAARRALASCRALLEAQLPGARRERAGVLASGICRGAGRCFGFAPPERGASRGRLSLAATGSGCARVPLCPSAKTRPSEFRPAVPLRLLARPSSRTTFFTRLVRVFRSVRVGERRCHPSSQMGLPSVALLARVGVAAWLASRAQTTNCADLARGELCSDA